MHVYTPDQATPDLLCRQVTPLLKKAYDFIIYSDNRWGNDPQEQHLALQLAKDHQVLLIQGQSCPEMNTKKPPVFHKEGNLHIMHFDELDKYHLWVALPRYISNITLPAVIFFSPVYSLLKTIRCRKVIYFSNSRVKEMLGEVYLLNEADLVLNEIDKNTPGRIMEFCRTTTRQQDR